MQKAVLKRLSKKKEVVAIINDLAQGPFAIVDTLGQKLMGSDGPDKFLFECPVKLEGETIGLVKGGEKASAIAALVSYLAAQELQLRSLGRETLEKYKEITILYDITEKLASCLNPLEVSHLVIDEVKRLIRADNISVMILNEDTGMCEILNAIGKEWHPKVSLGPGKGIGGSIITSGKAEIVNDVLSDPRYIEGAAEVCSLMCAPLKIKDRIIGTINLSSNSPASYTAEDLKMLSALALQAAAAIENARLYDVLKETFLTAVHTLAETIEQRDPYTGGHTKRVMEYSMAIGKELGLPDAEMERLKLAAMLHDVGKIGVRDDILLKNGRLTDEEFNIIKMHTFYGQEVLKHIKYFKDIIPGVKYHHERYDGKGYPEGLRGEEIDITARIIAVADTYDAMTTDRPYRKGLSHEEAVEEIKKNSGSQFEPAAVEVFLKVDMVGLKKNIG